MILVDEAFVDPGVAKPNPGELIDSPEQLEGAPGPTPADTAVEQLYADIPTVDQGDRTESQMRDAGCITIIQNNKVVWIMATDRPSVEALRAAAGLAAPASPAEPPGPTPSSRPGYRFDDDLEPPTVRFFLNPPQPVWPASFGAPPTARLALSAGPSSASDEAVNPDETIDATAIDLSIAERVAKLHPDEAAAIGAFLRSPANRLSLVELLDEIEGVSQLDTEVELAGSDSRDEPGAGDVAQEPQPATLNGRRHSPVHPLSLAHDTARAAGVARRMGWPWGVGFLFDSVRGPNDMDGSLATSSRLKAIKDGEQPDEPSLTRQLHWAVGGLTVSAPQAHLASRF